MGKKITDSQVEMAKDTYTALLVCQAIIAMKDPVAFCAALSREKLWPSDNDITIPVNVRNALKRFVQKCEELAESVADVAAVMEGSNWPHGGKEIV